MKKKRRSAEQILKILQEIDASLVQGSTVEKSCREHVISDATYYTWRKSYGRMKVDQVKRLRELEKENDRLKKVVADLSLDKAILNEALKGNY
jgi:transposase-like protein